MAFLTAASPCALAIGTPAAVLSGIARAAQIGVLVKGGVHLENLGRVRAVAFDKTGTLTGGRPKVTRVIPLRFGDADENGSSRWPPSVDAAATHPLATAIVGEAQARSLHAARRSTMSTHARRPRRGRAASTAATSTSASCRADDAGATRASRPLAAEGRMLAQVVASTIRPIGVIALADTPRANAADSHRRAARAGHPPVHHAHRRPRRRRRRRSPRQLGVDEVHAELLPEDKLTCVRELQQKHGPIAMVGDGVNDAPALATATVGIAMGGAGTDVAIETADVALMADDLAKLPDAIGLSRFSRRIIKQNLVIALGVIARPRAARGAGIHLPRRRGAVPRGLDGRRRAQLDAAAALQTPGSG